MRVLLGALLVVSACAAPATSSATSAIPTSRPSPTATLHVNVDSMMGNVPSATVFLLSEGQLHAVNLLNHHGRYSLELGRAPQVALSADGSRVYVLDEVDAGLRLRGFHADSGRACCPVILLTGERVVATGIGRGAIAATDQAVYVLLEAGQGVRVDAFSAAALGQVGAVVKSDCGDRVLASTTRIAIVCLAAGWLTIATTPEGGQLPRPTNPSTSATRVGDGRELAGAAMLPDGTIFAARPDGSLLRVKAAASQIETLDSYPPGAGGVLRDGVAIADAERIVIARRGKNAIVQVHSSADGRLVHGLYRLPAEPTSGVLALWPFAYFTTGRGVWHVDLQNGLLETMVTVDAPSLGGLAAQ